MQAAENEPAELGGETKPPQLHSNGDFSLKASELGVP